MSTVHGSKLFDILIKPLYDEHASYTKVRNFHSLKASTICLHDITKVLNNNLEHKSRPS